MFLGADHFTSEGVWVIWSSHQFFLDCLIHNENFFLEYVLVCYFFLSPIFCIIFFLCGLGWKSRHAIINT